MEELLGQDVDLDTSAAARNDLHGAGVVGYVDEVSEPMLIAEALAGRGDLDAAIPWLNTAAAKRGSWFLHLAKSPAFDPLRDDPRFLKLVAPAAP